MIIAITRSGSVIRIEEGVSRHWEGDTIVCRSAGGERIIAFAASDLRAMTIITDGVQPEWELFHATLKPRERAEEVPEVLTASRARAFSDKLKRRFVAPVFPRTRSQEEPPAS